MSETSSSLPARRMLRNELVRGADFNALGAEVQAISADAGLAVHPEQAEAFAFVNRRTVRIIDKQQNTVDETWSYGWVDVNEREDGKVDDRPGSPGGNTGNSSSRYYPARERSGNPDVPLGAIVKLEPGTAGSYYVFDYPYSGHWFEVLSGAGPVYSCRAKYHVTGTTWSDLIDSYTGTTITRDVREIHGITGLQAGTIVRAWHGGATLVPQVIIRRVTLGNGVDVREKHSLSVVATAGTYTLTFEGVGPTAALAWDHDAASLEAALEGLANLTAVTVTGSSPDFEIEYLDDFAPHEPGALEADRGLLLGDQEWLCDCMAGGNVTFNDITVNNLTINETIVLNTVVVTGEWTWTNVTWTVNIGVWIWNDVDITINQGTWVFNQVTLTFDVDSIINFYGTFHLYGTFVIEPGGIIEGTPVWGDAVDASLVTQVCISTTIAEKSGTETAATGTWTDLIDSEGTFDQPADADGVLHAEFGIEWQPTQDEADSIIVLATDADGMPLDSYEFRAMVDGTPTAASLPFAPTVPGRYIVPASWKVAVPEGTGIAVKLQHRRASGSTAAGITGKWTLHTEPSSTVERWDFDFPNGTLDNGPWCEKNPTDCCAGVEGEGDPGDRKHVDPGPTCAEAAPVVLERTNGSYTIVTGEEAWFEVEVEAGTSHLLVDVSAITGGNGEIALSDTDCDEFNSVAITGTGEVCTFALLAAMTLRGVVRLDGASSMTFTVKFGTGGCP